jgi:hypothetical protein
MEAWAGGADNPFVWRPRLGLEGISMLQWKMRMTVLAVSLAAIASVAGGFGPILWGWGK